jgi:hypothetical protein
VTARSVLRGGEEFSMDTIVSAALMLSSVRIMRGSAANRAERVGWMVGSD